MHGPVPSTSEAGTCSAAAAPTTTIWIAGIVVVAAVIIAAKAEATQGIRYGPCASSRQRESQALILFGQPAHL